MVANKTEDTTRSSWSTPQLLNYLHGLRLDLVMLLRHNTLTYSPGMVRVYGICSAETP